MCVSVCMDCWDVMCAGGWGICKRGLTKNYTHVYFSTTGICSHLSDSGVLLKCSLIVRHPPWHRRLGGVGIYDTSSYEGRGWLRSPNKTKGAKDGCDGPGERGRLDRWGEGGVAVDLEDRRVEVNSIIVRYLHVQCKQGESILNFTKGLLY